uniref:CCD97-like C-terminal domain-containing protein n=1 Tax=Aegilops tauschii subsp. strangulata TaxID=200361 RepID=A0A453QKN7_AEGTS
KPTPYRIVQSPTHQSAHRQSPTEPANPLLRRRPTRPPPPLAMEPAAMDRIAARLSAVDGLYFPTAFLRTSPPPETRKSALLDLLSRDAPLFLERYGAALRPDELAPFDALRDDYEVGWHL